MEVGMTSSNPKPPFKTIFFNSENKIIIALLFSILWYTNDEEVDESILGFLSQLYPIINESSKLNIPSYLAQIIN